VSTAGVACLWPRPPVLLLELGALRGLRRRLEVMGHAEHELRGLATACERMRAIRRPPTTPTCSTLNSNGCGPALPTAGRAGLAGAARRGRRAAGGPLSHVERGLFVRDALEPWRTVLRRRSLD
jgi:hypothetical protein